MSSNPKLSLAHATLLDLSPPDLIRVAHPAGFEAVGLRLIPIGLPGERRYALTEDPTLAREIRRALDDTGIRFLDVEVVRIHDEVDPGTYAAAFEGAAALGARFAITNIYTADHARAAGDFARVCELANPLGLTMLIEPVSFSNIVTVAQALDLVRTCGHENAGVLVDTLHLHSSGESPAVLDQLSPDLAPFIHLCDAPAEVPADPEGRRRIARAERLLPGEGGIDLAGMLRCLPHEIMYAVEAHNPARAAALGAEAYAKLAFEKSQACLKKFTIYNSK
jgi:sugar phosphate isomerase/epimerase